MRNAVVGAGVGLGATLAFAAPASAQDFTVTSLANSGPGSLRESINLANDNPGADRILFQSGLSGAISFNTVNYVYDSLDVVGPGADKLTIQADLPNESGMFNVRGEDIVDPIEFGISGLTLKNGGCGYGGAIGGSYADIDISNSVFTGNQASLGGAVGSFPPGSLTVTNSTFTGNGASTGGAIASAVPTTIDSSTFSGNRGQSGGGAIAMVPYGDGSLNITNSTLNRNVGGLVGGAIASFPNGDDTFTLSASSTTISGNQALYVGGGIGGGFTSASLNNSIIENNFAFYGPDLYGGDFGGPSSRAEPGCGCYPGTPFDTSFTFVGDTSGADINTTVAGSNILNGGDAVLGRLADNGGPTKTMAVGSDSPVVNKGSSALAVDQRGDTRPVAYPNIPNSTAVGANGADMGAFELQYTAPPPPPPPTPPVVDRPFRINNGTPNRKTGASSVEVEIPAAGTVQILGYRTFRSVSTHFDAKGTYNVKAVPKGNFKKRLNKVGRARHIVRFQYIPDVGTRLAKGKVFGFFKGASSGNAKAAAARKLNRKLSSFRNWDR